MQTERPTATVYVRKAIGPDNYRTIAFRRIPEIPSADALSRGWAIDGNQYAFDVPLERLATAERALVEQLEAVGYEVDFA